MNTLTIILAAVLIVTAAVIWSLVYTERRRKQTEAPMFQPGHIVAVDRGDSMFVGRILSVSETHARIENRNGQVGAYPIGAVRVATKRQIESYETK